MRNDFDNHKRLQRSGNRLGIGRSRRTVNQMPGWLRAGKDHMALVTNGR